jgi:diguanylate cyclase (GGDEF)-like protein
MTKTLRDYFNEYVEIVRSRLEAPDEQQLLDASEIGAQFLSSGIAPEDVGEIHERAVAQLAESNPGLTLTDSIESTVSPLVEVLVSYGNEFRRTTEEKELAVEELRTRSLTDSETGLASRTALVEALRNRLAENEEIVPFSIISIGIDRLTDLNAALGYEFGKTLVMLAGTRIADLIQGDVLVARVGPDNLGFHVIPGVAYQSDLNYGRQIQEAFVEPFEVNGEPVILDATVGISHYPGHGSDADQLLQRAEIAMREAQRTQLDISTFTSGQDQVAVNEIQLLAKLRQALDESSDEGGVLELHYQPKVSLESGNTVGCEALIRWKDEDGNSISPAEFIPAAERTGLHKQVDNWVMNTAAKQAFQWRQIGLNIPIAINLSARSFVDPNLVSTIQSLISRWGIDHSSLELEVTETALMSDPEQAAQVCKQLRELNIDLSIDDFGTGQSSMAYLRDLSVTHVKIDQSFVMQMATDEGNAAIVKAVIEMAGSLGKKLIAEGVEDDQTAEALIVLGCEVAQGWNYAKAMPANEWPTWLEKAPLIVN